MDAPVDHISGRDVFAKTTSETADLPTGRLSLRTCFPDRYLQQRISAGRVRSGVTDLVDDQQRVRRRRRACLDAQHITYEQGMNIVFTRFSERRTLVDAAGPHSLLTRGVKAGRRHSCSLVTVGSRLGSIGVAAQWIDPCRLMASRHLGTIASDGNGAGSARHRVAH